MPRKYKGQPMVNSNNSGKHLRAYEKKVKTVLKASEVSKAEAKHERKEMMKEKKEHPWMSKKDAGRVAEDHEAKRERKARKGR